MPLLIVCPLVHTYNNDNNTKLFIIFSDEIVHIYFLLFLMNILSLFPGKKKKKRLLY